MGEKPVGICSYAQNFEDVRLWRALGHIACGRYIDIGAQDPVRDSVSLAFYARGWRGIHVEPVPAYAAALRAARPNEIVLEAAVTNRTGALPFHVIAETGLSTGIAQIARRHRQCGGWAAQRIEVASVTLAAILDLAGPGPVHWLKIDVEGMEQQVLNSWGDHPARPWVVVIESTPPLARENISHRWIKKLAARGYRHAHFDGINSFFVADLHTELGEQIAASPNAFDGFQVTEHHFSTVLLQAENERKLAELQATMGCGRR